MSEILWSKDPSVTWFDTGYGGTGHQPEPLDLQLGWVDNPATASVDSPEQLQTPRVDTPRDRFSDSGLPPVAVGTALFSDVDAGCELPTPIAYTSRGHARYNRRFV